jgi:hypothetical protein
MEEIAAFLIQILIEVGIQFLGGLGFDLATTRYRADGTTEDGCSGPVLFAVLGGACGGLSLLAFPNLILPTLGLRVANLVLAPLAAGGLSYLVAANIWPAGKQHPVRHFWRAFWFALAFGLVRFAYAHR